MKLFSLCLVSRLQSGVVVIVVIIDVAASKESPTTGVRVSESKVYLESFFRPDLVIKFVSFGEGLCFDQ